jgi:hypothetical protein
VSNGVPFSSDLDQIWVSAALFAPLSPNQTLYNCAAFAKPVMSRFLGFTVLRVMAQLDSVFKRTLLTRTLISSAALGLAFGCGVKREVLTSDTGGASNSSGTGGASNSGGTSGTTDMDASITFCPSATGHVTQLPTGTCSGTASCDLIVDAQCGPGITAIPATPPTFKCQCASGNWNCSVIAGGLGLIPCTESDAGNPITSAGGGSSRTDAGLNLATGGAGNTNAIDVCNIPDSVAATLQMGQACAPESCIPGGCFATGNNSVRMCNDGKVQTVTASRLDSTCPTCDISKGPWSDCNTALANGAVTGDTCNWSGGGCAQPTSDPCCIDAIDSCAGHGNFVRRYRMCAPGCTSAAPDSTLPIVTDCASVPSSSSLCRPWSPCQGSFVCYGGPGINTASFTDSNDADVVGIIWCAGGNLVGGYAMGAAWAG